MILSFNQAPEIEAQVVAEWLSARLADGVSADQTGVVVRGDAELGRARVAISVAGVPYTELDDKFAPTDACIVVSTMHLAKGLEFRAVAVLACDDEVIFLQSRIETVTDASDLEDVYATERHLLYVACTRVRDHLLVTGVDPASEFIDDLGTGTDLT